MVSSDKPRLVVLSELSWILVAETEPCRSDYGAMG